MKKVELRIENRIMVLINRVPAKGCYIDVIQRYFRVGGLQSAILREDIPGWLELAETKRMNRVNKVIRQLVMDGRARITNEKGEPLKLDVPYNSGFGVSDRLIPLNVLDKIVYALAQDDDG